eukprot:TRINITY_DN10174_c0_g1_i2.p3 TRINITY_DN10174_c0_g1~~TRINITY_DN10174_c0_g1_i2.p3  ORF type:complete len:223 (-),score=93.60 TRINITY_DN10174_c0_g1_i2:63-731(-)
MAADPLAHPPEPDESASGVEADIDGTPVRLILLDPPTEAVTTDKNEMTLLLAHSAGHLTASLTALEEENRVVDRGCLLQSRNNVASIAAHFPGSGEYRLAVSADLLGDGVYTQVMEYFITATVPQREPPREFPATFLQSHNCYIYTPQSGRVAPTWTPFVVEALAELVGVAVLSGDDLVYLQQRPGHPTHWVGRVRLQPGPVKVSSNIDRTHFEVFGLQAVE